jgi:hypothetical protein
MPGAPLFGVLVQEFAPTVTAFVEASGLRSGYGQVYVPGPLHRGRMIGETATGRV